MDKETKRRQLDRVHDLLRSPNPEGYTRMQIALCLGIERASVCRRIADLRDAGQVWILRKGIDPITKERAEFLTANPDVARAAQAKKAKPTERTKIEQTGTLF